MYIYKSRCRAKGGYTPLQENQRQEKNLTAEMAAPTPAGAAARDIARYFANSLDELSVYSFRDYDPSDMVCISFNNADNQNKAVELSYKRRDQLSRYVLWCVFGTFLVRGMKRRKEGPCRSWPNSKPIIVEVKA